MRTIESCILLLALTIAPLSHAQSTDAERREVLLEELLEAMDASLMIETVLRNFVDQMMPVEEIPEELYAEVPPEQREEYRRMAEEAREEQRRMIDLAMTHVDQRKVAREILGPIIDERFSTEELQTVVDFVRTPAGSELAALVPQLSTAIFFNGLESLDEAFTKAASEIDEQQRSSNPAGATMADMRSLATAMEAYAVDWDYYPDANDARTLASFIQPDYIRESPQVDGWGTEYKVIVSPDRTGYRIISAGADRRFQWNSDMQPGSPVAGATVDLDADIIYENGSFIQYPQREMQ